MVDISSDLRLGVVDFANVAPLVAGLPAEQQRRGVPAAVADWLATGEVDAGIVPAIELGRMPGLVALPSHGIAADGRCDSVLVFSREPLGAIRSLRLDPASRTSAVLARVLLEREGAGDVELHRDEPASGGPEDRLEQSLEKRLEGVDAALLIGDAALAARAPADVAVFDLATEWRRHVGLPFVFAVWASRAGRRLSEDERASLAASAEAGLARLPELAAEQAARTGFAESRLLAYFRTLQYRLTVDHLRGLRAFLDEAHRIGILPDRAEPTFYD